MDSLTAAPGPGRADTGRSRRALVVLVAALLLALDQLTKWLVVTHLQRGAFVRVCPFLKIKYTYNTGVAFGLWAGGGRVLPVLAAVCIIALLIWGSRYARRSALVGWALALVVGGALGNMLDRVRLGHVIDFIDLSFWPVFNFADMCVVAGALLLLYHGLRRHEPGRAAEVGPSADKEDA